MDGVFQRQMFIYGLLSGVVGTYKSDVLGKNTGSLPDHVSEG